LYSKTGDTWRLGYSGTSIDSQVSLGGLCGSQELVIPVACPSPFELAFTCSVHSSLDCDLSITMSSTISAFLQHKLGKISLRALLQAFDALQVTQAAKSFIMPMQIRASLQLSNHIMTPIELEFHAALILASCLHPRLARDGTIVLTIKVRN